MPDDPRALFAEAIRAQQGQRFGEAEALYRRVLAVNPLAASAHNNLGILLKEADRPREAEACFRQAIALRSEYPEALNNLGTVQNLSRDHRGAAKSFRRALALRPDDPELHYNLGNALFDQRKFEEAATAYRQAIARRPDYFEAYIHLGQALREGGEAAEASEAFQRAFQIKPQAGDALTFVLTMRHTVCEWHGLQETWQQIRDGLRAGMEGITPFSLALIPSTAAEQLECARRTGRALSESRQPLPAIVERKRPGPIRLGYLSLDFREHAVSQLVVELIELHDRSRFEVVGYSYGVDDHSAMRLRIADAFDRFVEVRDMSDKDAAELIRGDDIDILIDLAGLTGWARTGIMAFRPAPIQINYLGYPGTMGGDFIDFAIVDPFIAPVEDRQFYSEALAYLPHCYQPNDRKRQIDAAPVSRADNGLPEAGFVFCCFCQSHKLTPDMFAIWMRLLTAVPGSVLWLLKSNGIAMNNLRREAEALGVAADRLVFAPFVTPAQHLARHRLANLFLDTQFYNAHTTMSDALWTGLPAVTCPGRTFASRVGGSLLHAIGLPDLIAPNLEEYEKLALKLAQDPALLNGFRERLAANRLKAPLFDSQSYARHIESAYVHMFDQFMTASPPASFRVEPDSKIAAFA